MRRQVATLLTVVFLVSLGLTANAAVKPGTSCKKLGQTSISSGKNYTCVKSGKKLVWDKGVLLPNPKSATTTTPAPSSKLTPTPTPSSTPTPTNKPETNYPRAGGKCSQRGSAQNINNTILLCVPTVNNQFTWIDYTDKKLNLSNQSTITDFSSCRLTDSRVRKIQSDAITYPSIPRDPSFTSTSTITIAIVPIDFPDIPGTYDSNVLSMQIQEETNQWNSWYSRGKSKVNWIIYPNWIRSNKNSSEYNWIHPLSMTSQVLDNSIEIGQNLVDLAETKIDLRNVQDLLFVYPKEAINIQDSINYQRSMNTKNGQQVLGIYATSAWSYRDQESLAMWLIHENMHRFGYAGHSPAWPPLFSIASNQAGLSRVMNVWDRMVLDWLNPGDVLCTDIDKLSEQTYFLVPQEREQFGLQGLMIKLSNHELLVIESHKKDKWSQGYPADFYGITLMYVDTSRDTDRSGENFGDDLKGTNFSRTATYIDLHELGHAPPSRGSISDGVNYLLYQGENFVFKGIKIDFLESGFNDKVKISRISA